MAPLPPLTGAAALHHLTGPTRGRAILLDSAEARLILAADRRPRLTPPGAPPGPDETVAARLRRTQAGIEVEAEPGALLWINARPVRAAHLRPGDLVEFGERGPISRVTSLSAEAAPRATVTELAADFAGYLRSSRRPLPSRAAHATGDLVAGLATRTTPLFRIAVVLALLAAGGSLWQQQRSIARLEGEAARLDAVSATLARAAEEAVTGADLAAAREAAAARLAAQEERLARLEAAGDLPARVIAEATPSVAFLQGSYGFREPDGGRWLRLALGEDGRPLLSPFGRPRLTLEGEGPVATRDYTGTGVFVAPPSGEGPPALVTNRHVALPWERDGADAAPAGLTPELLRLEVWRPGRAEAHAATLALASERADLALLTPDPPVTDLAGLPLADGAPPAGTEVIALGYPTGLRALLAQAPPETLEALRAANAGFREIAVGLAAAGAIRPLASRGIVARAGPQALVFDAETTRGGSGGAVLDRRGRVLAIQSAIMPEFGGANIAVPAAALAALLAEAAGAAPDG